MNKNIYCNSCTPWDRNNWGYNEPEILVGGQVIIRRNKPEIKLKLKKDLFITKTQFYEKYNKNLFLYIFDLAKKDEKLRNMLNRQYLYNDLYYPLSKLNNHYEHLQSFYNKLNNDIIPVIYKRHDILTIGNIITKDLMSSNSFYGIVKKNVIRKDYYDFDLTSCYFTIIKNICEEYNISCPVINDIIINKKRIFSELSRKYNLGKNEGDIFCKKMFFLTFYNPTKEEYKIIYDFYKIDNSIPIPDLCNRLIVEITKIRKILIEKNPEMYQEVRRIFPYVKDKVFRDKTNQRLGKGSLDGLFMSLYLCEFELQIVDKIVEWLYNNTNCLRHRGRNGFFIYEYDSFLLLKSSVDECFQSLDELVNLLNEKTIELTGVNIKWQYKQYEDELEDLKEKIVEMDPALYNVLNGCWLCNYDKQNLENDYLMDRSFFNGVQGPPCNYFGSLIPRNSKDFL